MPGKFAANHPLHLGRTIPSHSTHDREKRIGHDLDRADSAETGAKEFPREAPAQHRLDDRVVPLVPEELGLALGEQPPDILLQNDRVLVRACGWVETDRGKITTTERQTSVSLGVNVY